MTEPRFRFDTSPRPSLGRRGEKQGPKAYPLLCKEACRSARGRRHVRQGPGEVKTVVLINSLDGKL